MVTKLFSDEEVKTLTNVIITALVQSNKGRVTGSELFVLANLSEWTEPYFKQALGVAFNNNKFPGFKTKLGKYGGIVRDTGVVDVTDYGAVPDLKPPIKFTNPKTKPLSELKAIDIPRGLDSDDLVTDQEEAAQTTKPTKEYKKEPPPTRSNERPLGYRYARYVWIGNRLFLVPYAHSIIENIVVHVLGSRLSETGQVVFNGKKYSCEHVQILERLLISHMFAVENGESEPVLDDGSGVSVEMRVEAGLTNTKIDSNILKAV